MIRNAVAALALATSTAAPASALDLFSVGSGDISGNYYSIARAICRQINLTGPETVRCSPEPTNGSIYNLLMLQAGEIEFAFSQSDWHRAAYKGVGVFAGGPAMTELRSVIALYPETITIIAASDSDVATAADLVGSVVDIGLPSSGRNATVKELLKRLDLSLDTIQELDPQQATTAICENQIDATIFVIGHPNAQVADLLARCSARLVPFTGPAIHERLGASDDYIETSISADTYPGLVADIASYAVYATIVTRADVDEDLVELFVSGIVDNLEAIAARAFVLNGLTPEVMRTRGLTAPLHPGAERALSAREG